MYSGPVFSSITIVPDFYRGHFIQWQLDPFFNAPRPYSFTLQCSQTLEFSELIFEKELGDTFYAVDTSRQKQAWASNYAYRVILTAANNDKYYSHAAWFGNNFISLRKYAAAAEIVRKEQLNCRYAGQRAWLLKRKSYGSNAKVRANVDPVSGVAIADVEEQDFGVGLDDGYFPPVAAAYVVEGSGEEKQLDPQGMGIKETRDMNVRMPGYPLVDTRDVIVTNLTGFRFSVVHKNASQFPGTNIAVFQKATLRLIPPTDTIYSMQVPREYNELK